MTVYKVWKPGQDEPEVVEARELLAGKSGMLYFGGPADGLPGYPLIRKFQPHEWSRWSVVPDDAGRL